MPDWRFETEGIAGVRWGLPERLAQQPSQGHRDGGEGATALHEVLGPEFARVWGIVKRTENEEFLQVISPWEREHLLLNV